MTGCGLWLFGALVATRGTETAAGALAGAFAATGALALAGAFAVAGAPEDGAAAVPAGTALNVGADAAVELGAAGRLAWRPVASASAFVWSEEIARRSSDSAVAVRALG